MIAFLETELALQVILSAPGFEDTNFGRLGYAGAMVFATLVAGWLYRRGQDTSELTREQRWGIAFGGVLGATFAAKIPFVLGSTTTGGWFGLWLSDGKTLLWGLTGGYIGVEVAKWSLYVRQRTGDRFTVPVAVAIGIGRIGCLFNGCCYGVPTDDSWGVRSGLADGGRVLRHPAPLYEMAFHLGFAILATIGLRKGILRERWMLVYLISYCLFRFVSEFWREEPQLWMGLTFYQLSAVPIAIAFATVLVARSVGQRNGLSENEG
ncbi:prolipoprotein diacylglyceryl transferase family protein [Roseiconus lacunae]|uniref:prolipoprotein diacylglyceryl transferase n=1 Tax=Roseiconus lacunae TaxID=2605694 RepID=UPI0030859234|nr:prolipoprotein diacylglyceryl transferase family protein [Stieleria sp. HD01]